MPLEKLTRARLVEALNLLGQLAEQEGVTLELCLYGGAAMMLAMKCLSCRPELPGNRGDVSDIRFLIGKMGIRSMAEIEAHLDRFYPHDALTTQARAIIGELLATHGGEKGGGTP